MPRTSIPKLVRIEVFKRDSFTCQYCGRRAPDVLLEIDHIEPVAKGGTNDILNLLTSCADCNSGKSDRRLCDQSVLVKQRQQLEHLQERKEHIEMMFEWQKGLLQLENDVIDRLSAHWSELVSGYYLNEHGLSSLKRLKKKYEVDEIMRAMRTATEQYLICNDGHPAKESVELAWSKVGGICRVRRLEPTHPHLPRLYYILGILRNRFRYANERMAFQLLTEAVEANASIERLEEHAKTARNWTEWLEIIEDFIAARRESEESLNDQTSAG